MSTTATPVSPKFDAFDVRRAHYESDGVKIGVDILVPKNGPTPDKRPVYFEFHGGWLVSGASLFAEWFSQWTLDYATLHGAVIIAPNYRLLPEVKGKDILHDLGQFWQWFASGGAQKHLESVGRSDVVLDPDHLLVAGASAGGYMAIQSVLLGLVSPRAVLAFYPMLDLQSPWYTQAFEKVIFGQTGLSNDIVNKHLESLSDEPAVVTEAFPPVRMDLALAAVHNGRFGEFLGQDDPAVFPFETVAAARAGGKALALPPLCILHGRQDSGVPVAHSEDFVEKLKEASPEATVKLVVEEGDHGFDGDATLDTPWLSETLAWAADLWLK